MRKILIVVVSFLVSSLIFAQDRDFSKVQMKVTKVAGNIYVLQGAGGNIGASVGEDGIVIVDDQFAPLVEKIRAALKDISDKPVRFVINTHWHSDHTGGNEPFSQTSTVIAHENVRKRLETASVAGNGGSIHFEEKAAPKAALPIITFREDSTIHLNDEDIEILHYPSGHTDGDSVVFFRKSNVVHMGDDFVTYGFPFIDVDSGGSIKGLIQAVEQILKGLPADVKIIPGHGDVATAQDVKNYLQMLKDTTAAVEKALSEKKSVEDMKKEKILDRWKQYSGDFITTDVYIETLYNSLTLKKNVGMLKHN